MLQPTFSFLYGGKPFETLGTVISESGSDHIYSLSDGLTVTLHITEYAAYHAVEGVLTFANRGSEDSQLLSEIHDCAVSLPVTPDPPCHVGSYPMDDYARISAATGCTEYSMDTDAEDEFRYIDYAMREGQKKTFRPHGVRSSSYAYPFFDVNHADDGYLVHWLERTVDSDVHTQT